MSDILDIPADLLNIESTIENTEKWDSLNQLTIILALEEHYKITFPDEVLPTLNSIKGILKYLEQIHA